MKSRLFFSASFAIVFTLIAELSTSTADAATPFIFDPPHQPLQIYRQSTNTKMDNKVSVLIWNIHKETGSENLISDLNLLSQNKELVLLQEATDEKMFISSRPNNRSIQMGVSFYDLDFLLTGVLTESATEPFWSQAFKSPVSEPITDTAKMSLFSLFSLQNGAELLVVNIHGINFVSTLDFQKHIDSVAQNMLDVIQKRNPKILLAGDFNTWNVDRMSYLVQRMTAFGLYHYVFGNDPRKLFLDHIFVKGCESYAGQVHSEVASSDHFPLTIELLCY